MPILIGALLCLAILSVAPVAGAAPVTLGTSVRVEYTDPSYSDAAYYGSDRPPGVRGYSRSGGYHALVRDRFFSVTPENELQFGTIRASRDGPANFGPADRVIAWARSIDKPIRGHALVFHDAAPRWLKESRDDGATTMGLMRSHIETTMRRYRGVVGEWDVVNEALRLDGSFRGPLERGDLRTANDDADIGSAWARGVASLPVSARGKAPAYVFEAFRAARSADPKARLCLNEVGAEGINARSDALLALARVLRDHRLLDCVGFEAHFTPEVVAPDADEMRSNFQRFADLGLEIQITEADMAIRTYAPPRPAPIHVELTWAAEQRKLQRAVFQRLAGACAAQPACTKLTVWGASDDNSWRGATLEPVLFTKDMRPKPVYGDVTALLAR